eukprot:1180360-Prorocentrum_minimum.AAC.1
MVTGVGFRRQARCPAAAARAGFPVRAGFPACWWPSGRRGGGSPSSSTCSAMRASRWAPPGQFRGGLEGV